MKNALVTGVSSGIGKKLTLSLLGSGWKVYGLSRRDPSIGDDNFTWIECDLYSVDQIASAAESLKDHELDLFVSNAGVAFEELASDTSVESYKRMFDVNVLAPMLLVNQLKSKLMNATVISISSVADRLVASDFALYCSAKAANTRYFESLAHDLSDARVFTLLPDYTDTPMLREQHEGRDFDWQSTIDPADIVRFTIDLVGGKIDLVSGSNIIIVTEGLKEDLKSQEKLYGYNTTTKKMSRLNHS